MQSITRLWGERQNLITYGYVRQGTYAVVAISTCCRVNTHPKTNNKKSGAREKKMRKTRSRCNSFACEGMNQPNSATGMHDCVINNRRIVYIETCQGTQEKRNQT